MKKKLTVNTLALGNLKQRKKQYAIMIVGIILALLFSTSMMLYFFSSYEAMQQEYESNYGKQDYIISVVGQDESVFNQAKEDGFLSDYGVAHLIGSGYTDNENRNVEIAWLDDKAIDYSNMLFIDGSYPTKENEIAIAKTMLVKLDLDAKVGDKITLNVKIQDVDDFYKTVKKTYTLVGITKDKVLNVGGNENSEDGKFIPNAFVAQNTMVDVGGKEKITAYCMMAKGINWKDHIDFRNGLENYNAPEDSFNQVQEFWYEPNKEATPANVLYASDNLYLFILIVALIVAAAVTIINAFNANLKDRKKQIGLLRAVGTTKRQIYKIFGREALIISLICTPVSIILSYLLVWIIFKITKTDLVMSSNLAVLPISAVIGFAVVMLAALIPLSNASRITPMQAIRDIEKTRKMKNKKIKTQKQFDVASILAKRSLAFSKASKLSVSVLLILTIAFSCLGFSFISYERANPWGYDYDYHIYAHGWSDPFNSSANTVGFDEEGYQDIISAPYISRAYGDKSINVQLQIDEFSDYFKSIESINNSYMQDGWHTDEMIDNRTYDNYYSMNMSDFSQEYIKTKELINESKESLEIPLDSYDESWIETLKDYEIDGEIDCDKLASGEEIILMAPQKTTFALNIDKRGAKYGYLSETYFDDEKLDKDFTEISSGESPFKVGDTLNITVISTDSEKEVMEITPQELTLKNKEVKIGAIISPKQIEKSRYFSQGYGVKLITTNQGMNQFKTGVPYGRIYMYCDTEINDDIENVIRAEIDPYVIKYEGWLDSNYANQKMQQNQTAAAYYSLLALIIICFVISASIINNTISARIRENKKEIGTIRAFGANEGDLVKSYVKQMLSMISTGIIGGFALYTAGFIGANIYNKVRGAAIDLIFDPWITLILCAVLFAICCINLWMKVRKEMKNSIIENIREL